MARSKARTRSALRALLAAALAWCVLVGPDARRTAADPETPDETTACTP